MTEHMSGPALLESIEGHKGKFTWIRYWPIVWVSSDGYDRGHTQTNPVPNILFRGNMKYTISWQKSGFLAVLALILICFKILAFALTPNPQFFLGDSASYLHTALTDWVPNDRSYWYGVWVRTVVSDTQSLVPLLVAQAAVSAGAAFLAACWAHIVFRPAHWILILLAFICALDPSQLLMERYVMTETLTLFFVALVFVPLTLLILKGNWGWMCMAVPPAVVVMALRFSLMPVIAVVLLAAPLLGLWARSLTWRRASLALVVALSVVPFGLHFSRDLHSGKFILAAWSPLLRHSDFNDPELARRVLNGVSIENTELFVREVNLWVANGLIHRIETEVPDEAAREHLYKYTAMQILRRDPIGVFYLGLNTYKSLWRTEVRQRLVEWDIGRRPFDSGFRNVLSKSFHLVSDEMPKQTIISRYYASIAPVTALFGLTAFLLIALGAIGLERKQVAAMLLMSLAGFMLVLVISCLTTLPVIRYLHPMGWILSATVLPSVVGRIKPSGCNR